MFYDIPKYPLKIIINNSLNHLNENLKPPENVINLILHDFPKYPKTTFSIEVIDGRIALA